MLALAILLTAACAGARGFPFTSTTELPPGWEPVGYATIACDGETVWRIAVQREGQFWVIWFTEDARRFVAADFTSEDSIPVHIVTGTIHEETFHVTTIRDFNPESDRSPCDQLKQV